MLCHKKAKKQEASWGGERLRGGRAVTCTQRGPTWCLSGADTLPASGVPGHLRFVYPFLNADNDSGSERCVAELARHFISLWQACRLPTKAEADLCVCLCVCVHFHTGVGKVEDSSAAGYQHVAPNAICCYICQRKSYLKEMPQEHPRADHHPFKSTLLLDIHPVMEKTRQPV